MLNQTVVVGRIVRDLEVKETESGKQYSSITLAVPRSFKNADGEYDTDFINVMLWNGIASNTAEYCKKGDLVAVKGRLQTNQVEKEDGTKETKMSLVCERLTFLTTRKDIQNHEVEDRDER